MQAFVPPHLSAHSPLETPSLGTGEAWVLGVRMAHSPAGDSGAGDRIAVRDWDTDGGRSGLAAEHGVPWRASPKRRPSGQRAAERQGSGGPESVIEFIENVQASD